MDPTKLKVRDLMQPDVARLDAEMSVDDALKVLDADRISGAPVVDGAERVVGVLSRTDLARAKEAEEGSTGSARQEYYLPDDGIDEEADEYAYKGDYSPVALSSGTVADWMSENVVAVRSGDSVRVACKRMRERRIHRVLVIDEGQLVGILSSFDVVRWIADHG